MGQRRLPQRHLHLPSRLSEDQLQPSKLHWPHQADGFTATIYDFGNGYGALHIEGVGTTHAPSALVPEGAITDTGEPIVLPTKAAEIEKNELHPLELPRFREPFINYHISPAVEVTAATLQSELETLKFTTEGN